MRTLLRWLGQPWVLGVFALALLCRLGFVLIVDQPLLYTHQMNYFTGGLRIAQNADPLGLVLKSDRWRTWAEHWTIAPLYYVFEAAVFRTFGEHTRPLVFLQCALGALTSVAVAAIGREVAGARGVVAGVVYAVYAQSVELPAWTLTENLHNVLFSVAFALILKAPRAPTSAPAWAGGFLLGASALARSVSSAFIPVVGLWAFLAAGREVRWRRSAILVAAGFAAILPWTARNFALGEHVLIETAAFENLWIANNFASPKRLEQQAETIAAQTSPAAKRQAAARFGWQGIRRHPGRFLAKVRANFWHYFRPEGLHYLLVIEGPIEPWRHAFTVVLEDGIVVPMIPLFLVFVLAQERTPAWALVVLWVSYLLFFEVVVFLNEVPRHRSALMPVALAGAAGGLSLMAGDKRRRPGVWAGLGLGLVVVWGLLNPYLLPACRAAAAAWALRPAVAALQAGNAPGGEVLALAAAARDPSSARPHLDWGWELARAGRTPEAVEAYEKGAAVARPENARPVIALSRLLKEAGRPAEAAEFLGKADAISWEGDPWMMLELAWRELPAPTADEVLLGDGDYGAARGFLHPRGGPRALPQGLKWVEDEARSGIVPPGTHRWTLHRAWLRIIPTRPAPAYDVTLWMGSPFPSPLGAPTVDVRIGTSRQRFVLGREVRPYSLRAAAPRGQELLVEIDSPTWNRVAQPAEQGVRVDRLTVQPAP